MVCNTFGKNKPLKFFFSKFKHSELAYMKLSLNLIQETNYLVLNLIFFKE